MSSDPVVSFDISSTVTLNNGVEMPRLGLGVWQSGAGAETRDAVLAALELGYRLIDTAAAYGNERDVGAAIRSSGVPRDEVFVTTKLWNSEHGYEKALRALERSRKLLGVEVVDLYLIHWPAEGRDDSWRALERLLHDGRCRAIGVSNYTIRHLVQLLGQSSTVPAVNQVEFHPFLYQADLLRWCHERGIRIEAYSPLARAQRMKDPVVKEIARAHGKTPAQVLIRWGLQHDLVVIPKSVRHERIAENADVFDFSLSDEEIRRLDGLGQEFRTAWDPSEIP